MKQKYDVVGMTCSACSAHVDKAVRHLDGVHDVNVNLLSNCMVVDYDENKVNDQMIEKAVEDAGYKAVIEKETVQAPNIFIPGKIPGLKTTAKVSTTPDLLVGNAHAQKSSEKPEELKVESLTVDEENLLKEEDKTKTSQAQDKEVNKSSLKPETINVGNKTQEKQTEEDRSI